MALVSRIPGKMGIGIVVEYPKEKPYILSKYIGEGTNNIAEYTALNVALKYIRKMELKDIEIKSDSNLMVNQVNGNWVCRDETLKEYCILAQNRIDWLIRNGYKITLEYIPRKFNLADEPAKNALKGIIK